MLVRRDGKLRVVIGLRGLNTMTKSDQYPLPRMDDIYYHVAGKTWFSTCDTQKGFFKVPLASDED